MKKTTLRLIAMCLAMLLVLTACGPAVSDKPSMQATNPTVQTNPSEPAGTTEPSNPTDPTDPTNPTTEPTNPTEPSTEPTDPTEPTTEPYYFPYSDMVYSRQDVEEMKTYNQAVLDSIDANEGVETLLEKIHTFYDSYTKYYTGYALANINYSKDLTNSYWEEEYNFFMDTSSEVDAMFDQLLHDLAKCPLAEELEKDDFFGEGFFEEYQGESLWDETFTALMNREAELLADFYKVQGEAVDVSIGSEEYYEKYGYRMADIFVEMIKVRQQIAEYAGYPDYPSFAYEFNFGRDYTPDQAKVLMADIKTYLAPLFHSVDIRPLQSIVSSTVSANQTFIYAKTCAKNIGGVVWDAFVAMEKGNLYDITYSNNKYDASFEIFIYDYEMPYVFVNPSRNAYDKLTFVHEFGHFANDYVSGGRSSGIDVAEIFSQGMEFLSLTYATGGSALTGLQMYSSLSVYVNQAWYAEFELRVYELTGDQLTRENVFRVFEEVGKEYGFNTNGRVFVQIPHFFMSPMYVISYVVSNDAAVQLYQLEQAEKGAGVAKYVENLDTTEAQLLGFIESAGLESPFEEGHIEKVRDTFAAALK